MNRYKTKTHKQCVSMRRTVVKIWKNPTFLRMSRLCYFVFCCACFVAVVVLGFGFECIWGIKMKSNRNEFFFIPFIFFSLFSLSFSSIHFRSCRYQLSLLLVFYFCFYIDCYLFFYYQVVLQFKREAETNVMGAQWVSFDF